MASEDVSSTPKEMSQELMKRELSQRLKDALLAKGWNQSELARKATQVSGVEIGRDSISGYVREKSLPDRLRLKAMADALGIPVYELLPSASIRERTGIAAEPHREVFKTDQIGEDKFIVTISTTVTRKQLSKLIDLMGNKDQ